MEKQVTDRNCPFYYGSRIRCTEHFLPWPLSPHWYHKQDLCKFDIGDCSFNGAAQLHIKIHEDNVGALALGKLEPRRMTPWSKHYAIKYHWFREHKGPRRIELFKLTLMTNWVTFSPKASPKLNFHGCKRSLWAGNPQSLSRGSMAYEAPASTGPCPPTLTLARQPTLFFSASEISPKILTPCPLLFLV